MSSNEKKILFICLGNICRSPITEAVLRHILNQHEGKYKWFIDSAGIGDFHMGKRPDARARTVMKKYSIPMDHRARQISQRDFNDFDYIFGMDEDNMSDLKSIAPNGFSAKIELFGTYDPQQQLTIRDPYYDDGDNGFEDCYQQAIRCSEGFAKKFYP